jgi:hypothetical protein
MQRSAKESTIHENINSFRKIQSARCWSGDPYLYPYEAINAMLQSVNDGELTTDNTDNTDSEEEATTAIPTKRIGLPATTCSGFHVFSCLLHRSGARRVFSGQ